MYKIKDYTKKRAEEAGLTVKPSTHKGKKLDVYRNGHFLAAIGDLSYSDYPTMLEEEGYAVAEKRRILYHLRHKHDTLRERLARFLLW